MTPKELASFRARLTDLLEDLEGDLSTEASTEASIEPDNAIGRFTRIEAIEAQAMDQAGRRRISQRIKQVHSALGRVDYGSYGHCVRCGETIPIGRLGFMPEATLCVECAPKIR